MLSRHAQELAKALEMAIKDLQKYIHEHALTETEDAESEKPVYRKPGFEGVRSFGDMEKAFGRFVRERREARRLNRAQMGTMVGLHETIFARYERAFSKLHATRLVHVCEILDCSPIEMIHFAAPHFFGQNRQEADDKLKLILRVLDMPASSASGLLNLVEGLAGANAGDDPGDR